MAAVVTVICTDRTLGAPPSGVQGDGSQVSLVWSKPRGVDLDQHPGSLARRAAEPVAAYLEPGLVAPNFAAQVTPAQIADLDLLRNPLAHAHLWTAAGSLYSVAAPPVAGRRDRVAG